MGIVHVDISMSLDGYIAGPGDKPDVPLGVGGDRLHSWFLESTERDRQVMEENVSDTRAIVAGRRTYDNSYPWWGPGNGPAGDVPVFVVSHSVPDDPALEGSPFTFVTDGLTSTLKQAQDTAGDGDVSIMGGASVIQQALRAKLIDEVHIHLVPLLFGAGKRLFDDNGDPGLEVRQLRSIETTQATHLTYKLTT